MSEDPRRRLILEPLSASAWRLCDATAAASDAAHLIAYVEAADDGGYDVTWVFCGRGTGWYPTVDELLRGAIRYLAAAAPRRAKPKPIAHRPPLAAL